MLQNKRVTECVPPNRLIEILNKGARVSKVAICDTHIYFEGEYSNGQTICSSWVLGKSKQELENMTVGELYRASRGVGMGRNDVDYPEDCIFLVEHVSAEMNKAEGYYDKIYRTFAPYTCETLKDAFDGIDIVDCFWSTGGLDAFTIKALSQTDKFHWDGNENEDVETYHVLEGDDLVRVIHCQYTGDYDELMKKALRRQDYDTEFIPSSLIAKAVDELKRICEAQNIPFVDERDNDD